MSDADRERQRSRRVEEAASDDSDDSDIGGTALPIPSEQSTDMIFREKRAKDSTFC